MRDRETQRSLAGWNINQIEQAGNKLDPTELRTTQLWLEKQKEKNKKFKQEILLPYTNLIDLPALASLQTL